jgi:hypothetical protein
MAITTTLVNQFKQDALAAAMPSGNVYKLALIKPDAAGGTTTAGVFGEAGASGSTTYVAGMGGYEVATGGGYTQGGWTLSGYTPALTGNVASVDFADVIQASATIEAIGAVLYNSTSGKVIAIFDFGGNVKSTNDTFTINIPGSGVGVIRLS